ncbi:3-hydroxylacyl-(acyl carrier protein) dehydratase-like protein [Cupriavidus basilensis OR16]|uniref:3-hydroxylacyl-(Acyl carrier protein) dehydratase-like protein n=1 Tax=Cupriavidus basilensis OR16 TaxID=1127483 RepID=H1RYN9_9BURK|nr:3-hydroxylacyl-(acyl carrier protein) dehydratase-like protein [Cupriavidus basilensis OR16]
MNPDTAPLRHAWIAAHIPHQGTMCLLDSVLDWSPEFIRCEATSHSHPDNPLRAHGRLAAVGRAATARAAPACGLPGQCAQTGSARGAT